ncbi:SRPBCC family protein [Algiphilus sp. W345]|uniref:SRPBCC family protein n=1 Tax=Banduia mediterranea TaxID=3075609 RepID=A0ABU2WJK8_9GAMM|nr:SRPBCC family protein [Algiphilus sp. W345]MDT0498066.1 SRPBCC family protein [Algiphilus sp. W345]
MGIRAVHFRQSYKASPEAVFAYFAEHENLTAVFGGKIERIVDAPEGTDPNGVGSVRRVNLAPGVSVEETVTAFDPPRRIEYRISRGSPIRKHLGVMLFSPEASGTSLDYRVEFQGRVPGVGWLTQQVLQKVIGRGLKRVAMTL